MKVAQHQRVRTAIGGARGQAVLAALLWIAVGMAALCILCMVGPALIAYATAIGLPMLMLAPLISTLLAGWDVGGLLLILVGISRLRGALALPGK